MIKEIVGEYITHKPRKTYDGRISPSMLGQCMRKHYLVLKGYQETTPPSESALINFEVGHIWEEFIVRAIQGANYEVTHYQLADPWYDDELNIRGTPDIMLHLPGENIIVDSKTVAANWFWFKENEFKRQVGSNTFGDTRELKNDWLAKEHPEYVLQIGTYILLAQRRGIEVNRGILAFAAKDDGFIGWELEVNLTPELKEAILRRVDTLNGHLNRNELPPCECQGWKIGYCSYGNPETREFNKKKKLISTECCDLRWIAAPSNG